MFVGREAELVLLTGALERAVAGHGSLMLLSGEPGIGKTRLADELAAVARAQGVAHTWGRCWESGGAPAYWPWSELLEAMARTAASSTPDGGEADARLATLLDRSRADGSAGADPDRDRFELYRAVLDHLRRAGERAPQLLIFDDIHAADLSSLHLLCFVARSLRGLPLLVVCTYRDAEARRDGEASEVLARVVREGKLVSLGRIGESDVRKLVDERGIAGDDTLARRVFQRTEGNPLFTQELIELLASHEGGAETLPIPLSVRETIRQRLAPCPESLRGLLVAAAVIGKEHDTGVLARMVAEELVSVCAHMHEAVERGLLVSRGDEQFAFSHVLIRDVLYADATASERARLHRAAAEALGAGVDVNPGERSRHSERTHHLLMAGPALLDEAVASAIAAARQAANLYAHEDAAALLERARRAVESAASAGNPRQHLVCDLLLALGSTHLRAGQDERGKRACLEAVDIAQKSHDAERLARAVLAYGGELTPGKSDPRLIAMLGEARQLLAPEHFALHARLLARLAAALQPAADSSVPVAMAREAVALARRAGERAVLLEVIYAAVAAMIDYCPPNELLPLTAELRQLCDEAGDRPKMLRALLLSVFCHLEAGLRPAAEALIDEYTQLARKLALPPHLWPIPMLDATLAVLDGEFDEAARLAAEGRRLAEAAGIDVAARMACFFFQLRRIQEDDDKCEEAVADFATWMTTFPAGTEYVRVSSAVVRLRQGDIERARELVETIDESLLKAEFQLVEIFAELCPPLRLDWPWIEELYRSRLPLREFFCSWGVYAFIVSGPIERVLGQLAEGLGRTDDAERHFERAVERAAAMRHRPMEARARYDLACSLARRGEGERARALATEALESAEAIGMSGLVQRAGDLLAALAPEAEAPEATTLQDAERSALAELAAGIAHEINTPLSAIRSNAELAGRALGIIKEAIADPALAAAVAGNPKLSRAFDALTSLGEVTPEAASRIHRVVLDLASFAHLDRAELAEVDVHECLDGVLRLLAHQIGDRIRLEKIYGELPRLRCHPQRINDALMALSNLAVDRIEDGGAIQVMTRQSGRVVVISLDSSGRPLTDQEKARLFDPSLARRGSSVGMRLGLAIAKRTIEEHGGSIAIDNRSEGGFRVRLQLPLAPSEPASARVADHAAAKPAPAVSEIQFCMDPRGEYWALRRDGREPLLLKDSRGLAVLAKLVAEPERELHVLDLTAKPGTGEAADLGDAGEALDEAARHAYKSRAQDLREELEEAERNNDAGRADHARTELEFLGAALSRAVGLGGRDRRVAGAAERARVAVQRSVRAALKKIAAQDATLGRYLDWAVHTGTFCCYYPRGRPMG